MYIENDLDIANSFNNYFYSVFHKSSEFKLTTNENFPIQQITKIKVLYAIKTFKNSTSKGPGGLPIYFIKTLQNVMLPILVKLYNKFILNGFVPQQ